MADLQPQTSSIQTIYSWFDEGKIFVNRRYQRKLVWTLFEKQKLIESILKKYPIPALFLAEKEDEVGTYEIIDGLQRLQAIMSFIEMEYSTIDGQWFDVNQFLTAKNRSDDGHFSIKKDSLLLNSKEISSILNYSLAISIMRNSKEEEINDVFDRINTYGHRLSEQERRQAGVQSDFSNVVREIACSHRGDESENILTLDRMPSISIDLPSMKLGYTIKADNVFWVKHGILNSTDLRDSLDEQCVADICATIVRGEFIPRSRDALDKIYDKQSDEYGHIDAALKTYGENKLSDEFKYCIQEIEKVCNAQEQSKLRDLVFEKRSNNSFQSVFSAIFIAFHELIIKEKKVINNYLEVKRSLQNVASSLDSKRSATAPSIRKKNTNLIKGIIQDFFIKAENDCHIYNNHKTIDVENILRRSEVEVPAYELKQGILNLDDKRKEGKNIYDKIFSSLCGIANIGNYDNSEIVGKLIIGVTDSDEDAERIKIMDKIEPKTIGSKKVVGIKREANVLGISVEDYYRNFCKKIEASDISSPLKNKILSLIDYNDFYGYGLIIISVPLMASHSIYDGNIYHRVGNSTEKADAIHAADIATRFSIK